MARTSRGDQAGPTDNWRAVARETRALARSAPRNPAAQELLNCLWPASREYYSPLNPVFLGQFRNLKAMNGRQVWLSRDGLIPLLWFFESHPAPKGFKGRLLVHEKLASFVPRAWRRCTGTYALEAICAGARMAQPRADAKNRQLLLFGVSTDRFSSEAFLKHQLEVLRKKVSPAGLARATIRIVLQGSSLHPDQGPHAGFLLGLASRLGTRLEAVSAAGIDSNGDWSSHEIVDLNEGLLCLDSYLTHCLLAGGARFFGQNPRPAPESSTPDFLLLSPQHGMRVSARIPGRAPAQAGAKTLAEFRAYLREEEKIQPRGRSPFPWPMWFTGFARTNARRLWDDGDAT